MKTIPRKGKKGKNFLNFLTISGKFWGVPIFIDNLIVLCEKYAEIKGKTK